VLTRVRFSPAMRILSLLIVAALAALGLAACGSSSSSSGAGTAPAPTKEVSPSGDIPDNQAYVAYSPPGGGFTVKVPEGWSRSSTGATTTFTDKLNSISMQSLPAGAAPTVRDARQTDLPKLAKQVSGFKPGTVTAVTRKAGPAVKITYLSAAPADPVTGKAHTNAVERYVFFKNGKDVVLTLAGPKGADNVDPWRIVTDSVAFR
jgi:hypothetical protein